METKQCPYCKEEIKAEAVKCKHCGEFLNSQNDLVDTSSVEVAEPTIATQNFNTAIITAIVSIILSFVDLFNDMDDMSKSSWKITILSGMADVWLWVYFRKYIKNFKSDKATILTTWIIVINILSLLLELILKALLSNDSSEAWKDADTLELVSFLFFIIVFITSIIVYIKTGIALQKIKNDFVGLLNELGMSIAYLLPFVLLLAIVDVELENNAIKIIGTVLNNVSTVIMILIFFRAKEYEE